MQIHRVCADRILDNNAFIKEVDWYEAGTFMITNKGERLLTLYGHPGITYRILDEGQPLPTIR